MEKLIVSIVLIVGWIIIESVKKARSSREDHSHPHADGHAPKLTMPNPWKLLEEQEEGDHTSPRPGLAHSHHAAAVTPERKPVAQKKARKKAALPEEGGSALNRPQNVAATAATPVGQSAFATIEPDAFTPAEPAADDDHAPTLTPEEQARRKAHFERWRRAIIDSQVLQPKF
ncbi:MAG: hypothetical protein K2K92_05660 [Duncaniella sp.]|nr:hypothetical protein [Duncaniella sp.]